MYTEGEKQGGREGEKRERVDREGSTIQNIPSPFFVCVYIYIHMYVYIFVNIHIIYTYVWICRDGVREGESE